LKKRKPTLIAVAMVVAGCLGLSVAVGIALGPAAGLALASLFSLVFGLLAIEVAP
jgi:hypothetical protein